jgi:Circularly permutated YpsA SLOG family
LRLGKLFYLISTQLYKELTQHQEGEKYRVIQHRFGWTDQDGNDNKFRFGKGTLRPTNLDQILSYQNPNQPKIDLIIPLSAFKGTDKDNPNEPNKPQIKPGLYRQKIWLGEKSQSELGKTAISQMIASFPEGIKDFTEQLELEAKRIKEIQNDPREVAKFYCEKYEKRKAFLEEQATSLEEEAAEDPEAAEKLETLREQVATDSNIYKLIKADLEGQGQLLETEKIQRELAQFLKREWRDNAIGKSLTFERALVIPSKDLQDGEISIPHYQDGEEVLNFRSPFLNSNGLCISTNKVVEDLLGPDGKPIAGVIAVSDETSEQIYNRLNQQVKSILPEARETLKLEGIENYLDNNIGKLETKDKIEFTNKFNEYIKELQSSGYELKILPQESEQDRQARDYDGDYIGFEQASKYPNLTAEAIYRNLPENAYDPTIKLKKQSFYREDGSQPEFEEIAIHMSDGISVGKINNHLTKLEALESEITILEKYGSKQDQIDYIDQVATKYKKLFAIEAAEQSKGDKADKAKYIPEDYREYMQDFIRASKQNPPTKDSISAAMTANKEMYREMIAEAAYQNQIAVDLFKSAKKPDMGVIDASIRILHRDVNYIKDKKNHEIYTDTVIEPKGYSPVELLISQTNKYFEKGKLESRDLVQFSKLFNGVKFTNQQKLEATLAKKEFDKLFNAAAQASAHNKVEEGPSAKIRMPNGSELVVTNLLKYDNQNIWKPDEIKDLQIKVVATDEEKRSSKNPHQYKVLAQINREQDNNAQPVFKPLGTLALSQEKTIDKLGVEYGREIKVGKVHLQSEISKGQIDLMYSQAYKLAEQYYNTIPDDEKLSMAAAIWAVATTRESGEESSSKKMSNFAFAAIPKEIISRQNELQFTEFTLTGHKYNNTAELIKSENSGRPQEIRFNIAEQVNSKGQTEVKTVIEYKNSQGEYETFGNVEARNAQLPIGTTATGTFEIDKASTATVTTKVPGLPEITFQIKELQRYGNQERYNNTSAMLTIEKQNLIREEYTINIKHNGKDVKLGQIDKESIKEGIAKGWLQEKPGTGQNLQLKIQTIATGNNAYAVAETADGGIMRINITSKDFKNKSINDRDFREGTVKAYNKQDVYVAVIDDKVLGIIGQHTEQAPHNFSKSKSPTSPELLIKNGIIKLGEKSRTIPVEITTNETTCTLSINPETVQYPDRWIKRRELIKSKPAEITKEDIIREQIIDKINTRPSIMFQDKEQKLVGLIGLAVDEKVADKTAKYLDKMEVTYKQLSHSQAKLEDEKGMAVFVIDKSTLSNELKQGFLERAGGHIKSADMPEIANPIIPEQSVYFSNYKSEYRQTLESLPNRPKFLSKENSPVPIKIAAPSQFAISEPETEEKAVSEGRIKNIAAFFPSIANSSPTVNSSTKTQTSEPIKLPSSQEGDQTKATEILPSVSSEKIEQLRSHLRTPPQGQAEPIIIGPESKNGLGAALALDTSKAKSNGNIQNDYPVEFAGNKYPDAKQACIHQKKLNPEQDTVQLIIEVTQAKLEQHPRLVKEITKRGGAEWLKNCSAADNAKNPAHWDGQGKQSNLINVITQAYNNVVEKQNNLASTIASHSTPTPIQATKTENQAIKVISGGQTGADMGGLIGAKALGINTGGTAAAGWLIDGGTNPNLQNYRLVEGEQGSSNKITFANRTIANIENSDGTILLGNSQSPGSKITLDVANDRKKPILAISLETVLNDKTTAAKLIEDFVKENNIKILNVAGNRERVSPGLEAATAQVVQMGLAPIVGKEINIPSEEKTPANTPQFPSTNLQNKLGVDAGLNISSKCPDPFGAVLTSTTVKSKQIGTIECDFPMSFRDNREMPAGKIGPETYDTEKPAGQPFLSAEQAFQSYKEDYPLGEARVKLMAEVLQAKFEQHPDIKDEITARGGVEWLKKCTYLVSPDNPNQKRNFFEGEGLNSPYIRALATAYTRVLDQNRDLSQPKPLQKNPAQQENYQQSTADKNIKTTHDNSQQDNSKNINIEDSKTQNYVANNLLENALKSTTDGINRQAGAMENVIDQMKATTLEALHNWHTVAQQLGRDEKYVNKIQQVTELYIKNNNIELDKVFTAMDTDLKSLEQVNEATKLADNIAKILGKTDINDITSVKTENYKIATKSQEKTYLIKDKEDNVLLYIKQGTTQTNNISENTVRDLRFIQFKIDNTLETARKELVEK